MRLGVNWICAVKEIAEVPGNPHQRSSYKANALTPDQRSPSAETHLATAVVFTRVNNWQSLMDLLRSKVEMSTGKEERCHLLGFSSRQGSGSYFRYFFSNSAAFFIWMGSGLFSMHSYSSTRTPTGALKTAPVT